MLGFLTLWSVIGALSNYPGTFLFSRIIEGGGMGLIALMAPAVIAMWFPPQKQGSVMGIWTTWLPVGYVITFMLAPTTAASASLQAV
jgi:MFS family permease